MHNAEEGGSRGKHGFPRGGLRSAGEPEDADGRGAPARRRAGEGVRALPRRRQQPRVPRLLRPARGASDHRRPADERAARVHEHAVQAPLGLRAPRGRRRLGHAADAPHGDRGDVQGRAPADARPPARAIPALPADRRGVRLPEPRVRGLGGGRRDRDPRDPRRRGLDQDVRRLDRPRRLPALQREHLADDDAARCRGRQRLHAGAGRAAVRHPSRPGAGLHRPEGRHVGQHPRHPRHRGQDRRAADRAVRLARGGRRARRRAVARARPGGARARRAGGCVEAPGDDAPRPAARRRPDRAGLGGSRPLAPEGDLPPLRVPRSPRPRGHAGRGAARRALGAGGGDGVDPVARGGAGGAGAGSTQGASRRGLGGRSRGRSRRATRWS